MTYWKRLWCWEGLGAGEGGDRGWDGWMVSLTRGPESEWAPGVGNGQGDLACCDSWDCKESDMTEWLNWTELNTPFFSVQPQPVQQSFRLILRGPQLAHWQIPGTNSILWGYLEDLDIALPTAVPEERPIFGHRFKHMLMDDMSPNLTSALWAWQQCLWWIPIRLSARLPGIMRRDHMIFCFMEGKKWCITKPVNHAKVKEIKMKIQPYFRPHWEMPSETVQM